MAAALGKFLVRVRTTGGCGALEFVDGAPNGFGAAGAGVGIDDRRDIHRAGNETGERGHLIEGEQADVGQPRGAVREARAADIKRAETRLFHLPCHRGVRHAGQRDDALLKQFTQTP